MFKPGDKVVIFNQLEELPPAEHYRVVKLQFLNEHPVYRTKKLWNCLYKGGPILYFEYRFIRLEDLTKLERLILEIE